MASGAVRNLREQLIDVAPLLLRLSVGATFIAHGYGKVFDGGAARLAGHLGWGGLSLPMAWMAALAEFGGGVLLVAGLFTRVAALGHACVMVVAILKVHVSQGFMMHVPAGSAHAGGYEWQLLLLCASVSLMLTGAGSIALDRVQIRRRA